jgi:pimeloyl-ACP methyl ester carboxylesterase
MQVIANGIRIEVDDQGPRDAPVVLLIMGLGMQLIAWPDELVAALLSRGFRVVRFDNRDIGLSQWFDEAGMPPMGRAMLRYTLHLPVTSPYALRDMARDALGVLDALDIRRAHVCGASMGGMIAQHLAVLAPQRVASLTLMMSSSGSRRLPQPDWPVRRALMSRPMGRDEASAVAWMQRLFGIIGSPAYPMSPERARDRAQAIVRRSWHPVGSARQLMAVVADGDRTPWLSTIATPTLVIHGQADPLLPIGCGRQLAQHIRDARTDFIEGMGHDLPLPLLDRFADGIAANALRAG